MERTWRMIVEMTSWRGRCGWTERSPGLPTRLRGRCLHAPMTCGGISSRVLIAVATMVCSTRSKCFCVLNYICGKQTKFDLIDLLVGAIFQHVELHIFAHISFWFDCVVYCFCPKVQTFFLCSLDKVKDIVVGGHRMDEVEDSFQSKRIVFVTVGTTSFDSLVRAVDTGAVREALFEKGYTHLLIQMGRGSYIPMKSAGEGGFVSVDYFTFSPSIADHLRSASLVISHAGSGSIFETLRLRKPLIVVVNEDLMDNHQSELAEELAERKHLFCARP
ncbi:uncharacterized protein [Primulina eburnea]|uniref:uncharacterized protein n=1 Tax=Primulina eburnea TaxID=1245227 RepID=UPI003C6C0A3B